MRAISDVGLTNGRQTVLALRGERLALSRICFSGRDAGPEEVVIHGLGIVELNTEHRILATVVFDPDDIDAAFVELDARYLAGEASTHARAWSLIAAAYAAVNRRQVPAATSDWTSVDRRRLVASAIEKGDLTAYVRAGWDLTPNFRIYVEEVHRLTDLGAVVTHTAHGTSETGFDAEWRTIDLVTLERDLVNYCELFDETDLDAALVRFDEINRTASQLENAASRVDQRFWSSFAARDWDALAKIVADDIVNDDRRRVVNGGIHRGRDACVADMRAIAEVVGAVNTTSAAIATRGEQLVLTRIRSSNRSLGSDEISADLLCLVEVDANHKVVAQIGFDIDDIGAAIAELDARYAGGEASAHARTWSVIARNNAAFNRREAPSAAHDWVTIDHRRGAPFEPGDLTAYIRSGWDVAPDSSVYIETAHRVSDLGAVVTQVSKGTSQHGFEAEWRFICLLTVDGEVFSGCELFDEEEIDAALARFEELSRPARGLENTASQVDQRFWHYFANQDWDAVTETVADDILVDDRRRVVNAGVQHGRDAHVADVQAIAAIGAVNTTSTVIATRGERLALTRVRSSNRSLRPEELSAEVLCLVELGGDDRIVARVGFDLEEIDSAIEELDARYGAGEAAVHANTWSAIAGHYAAYNRGDGVVPEWISVDHRRGSLFASGDLDATIRASRDLTPNLSIHIETVHRISEFGAVVTNMSRGTSSEGFDAEWRMIQVFAVEQGQISQLEIFDEQDLDQALARFDELSEQTPQLENAASRAYDWFQTHFAVRDFDAMARMLTDDHTSDDRRPVVGAGMRLGPDAEIEDLRGVAAQFANFTTKADVVATRGDRLALYRAEFSGYRAEADVLHWDLLGIVEINADGCIKSFITLDPCNIDAAFEELETRYIAGEAAAHSRTWRLVVEGTAAFNRHELLDSPPHLIDHRSLVAVEAGDPTAELRAMWDFTPDLRIHVEAVHRLSDLGAVYTHVSHGSSHEGFDAEWRVVQLVTVDGDLVGNVELFDEADLDTALARFDELNRSS